MSTDDRRWNPQDRRYADVKCELCGKPVGRKEKCVTAHEETSWFRGEDKHFYRHLHCHQKDGAR